MKEVLISPSLIKLIVLSSRYLFTGKGFTNRKETEVKQALGSPENTKSKMWTLLEQHTKDAEARGTTGI